MTEFGFIDHIKELFAALPNNGFEGIGDDCAVLPVGEGESLVFTTDMLAEGVHFLRSATSSRELGRKSLAVNLSDVASMGRPPGWPPCCRCRSRPIRPAHGPKSSCSATGNSPKRSASRSPGATRPARRQASRSMSRPSAASPTHTSSAAAGHAPATRYSSPENSDFRAPDCMTSSPDATTPPPPQPTATRSPKWPKASGSAHAPKYTP